MAGKNGHAHVAREKYLVDALEQLEKIAADATAARSYVAAVKAKTEATKVRAELDQLRETKRRSKRKRKTPMAVRQEEVLSEITRLREAATEAGSYVAAAGLLKLEREALTAAEAERRARDDEERAHLDDAAIVALLIEHIAALPVTLRERIREAIPAVQ
jgi:hypothetical protein